MALARRIVGGEEEEAETVEDVFVQARDAEATAEELLVDDGWKLVEMEPETVALNGNLTTGHHDAGDIGPTVELALGNGYLPANGNGVNGDGHYDEADEPQRTLFSWAEFMAEEPVNPKAHKGKTQAATLSMLGCAHTLQQEREAEPVAAGP